jgi:hypothetical protein
MQNKLSVTHGALAVVLIVLSALLAPVYAYNDEYEITCELFAGSGDGTTGNNNNAVGSAARFFEPRGVAYHPTWGVMMTDSQNDQIKTIDPDTRLVEWRVGSSGNSYTAGTGTAAKFYYMSGLTYNRINGKGYVCDWNAALVKELDLSSAVWSTTNKWGSGGSASGTNGIYTAARLHTPSDVQAHPLTGEMYECDAHGAQIRWFALSNGQTTTVAGAYGVQAQVYGYPGTSRVNFPEFLAFGDTGYSKLYSNQGGSMYRLDIATNYYDWYACIDGATEFDGLRTAAGCNAMGTMWPLPDDPTVIYFMDMSRRIKKVTPLYVYTVAGRGTYQTHFTPGTGTAIDLEDPRYSAWSITDNSTLYISNHFSACIMKCTWSNYDTLHRRNFEVARSAGVSLSSGCTLAASVIGSATTKSICGISGLVAYGADMFVAGVDSVGAAIFKVSGGTISRLTGSTTSKGSTNGVSASSLFDGIADLAIVSSSGLMYAVDKTKHTLREITVAGVTSLVAGQAAVSGNTDTCAATSGTLNSPQGVAVDSTGTYVYLAENAGSYIRRVDVAGDWIVAFAGTRYSTLGDNRGDVDGWVTSSKMNQPTGVVIDTNDAVLYFADTGNHKIRRVYTADGFMTQYACSGSSTHSDGPVLTAGCSSPTRLTVEQTTNSVFFISSTVKLRRIAFGYVTTIFNNAAGYQEGSSGFAKFGANSYLHGAASNKLYVGDGAYNLVRVVTWTTQTVTVTFTRSQSKSLMPTDTASASASPDASATGSQSGSTTSSLSLSPSWEASASQSTSSSSSLSLSASSTASGSQSGSSSLSLSLSASSTASSSQSGSSSLSVSASTTVSSSTTQTTSMSGTLSASQSVTFSSTLSPSSTLALSLSRTLIATASGTLTATLQPTGSATLTLTASRTLTASHTDTSSMTETGSSTPTITPPPTQTPTITPTTSLTATITPPPTPTATQTTSATNTMTMSDTNYGRISDRIRIMPVNVTSFSYVASGFVNLYSPRTSRLVVRVMGVHASNGTDFDSWWLEHQAPKFTMLVTCETCNFKQLFLCEHGFPCTQHVPMQAVGTHWFNVTASFTNGEQRNVRFSVTVPVNVPHHLGFSSAPSAVYDQIPFAIALQGIDAQNVSLRGADVLKAHPVTLTLTSTNTDYFSNKVVTSTMFQGYVAFQGIVLQAKRNVTHTTPVTLFLKASTSTGYHTVDPKPVLAFVCPVSHTDGTMVTPSLLNATSLAGGSVTFTVISRQGADEAYFAATSVCRLEPIGLVGTYHRYDACTVTCAFSPFPSSVANSIPTFSVNITTTTALGELHYANYGPITVLRGSLRLVITQDQPASRRDVEFDSSSVSFGCASVYLVDVAGNKLPSANYHRLYANGKRMAQRFSATGAWRICNVSATLRARRFTTSFAFRLIANLSHGAATYRTTRNVTITTGKSLCRHPAVFNESMQGCQRTPGAAAAVFQNCSSTVNSSASLRETVARVRAVSVGDGELSFAVTNHSQAIGKHALYAGNRSVKAFGFYRYAGIDRVNAVLCSVPYATLPSSAGFQTAGGSILRPALRVLLVDGKYTASAAPSTAVRQPLPVNRTPVVTHVTGCVDYHPSTAECQTNGASTLTVVGHNFDVLVASSAQVTLRPAPWPDATRCATVMSINNSVIIVTGCAGYGRDAEVVLSGYNTTGHSLTYALGRQALVSFVIGRESSCGRNASGVLCSLHGTCDSTDGTCACFSSATLGYYEGAACASCALFYSNSTACGKRCPGVSLPCTGHGRCTEGTCECYSGYAGAMCSLECAGGAATPCSNHGVCNATTGTCSCHFSDTVGYFNGSSCASCASGYSGSSCTLPCPRGTDGITICSGRGSCVDGGCKCTDGYCGTACGTSGPVCYSCPTGYYGPSCSSECAGGRITPCNGHGTCHGGTTGDGSCKCDAGYAGAACSLLCPGGLANICSGHGTCDTASAQCNCDANYATATCSVRCPETSLGVCDGHGTCSSSTGACTCDYGYSSANCSLPCPGGVDSPCTNHGACNSDVTCTCSRNTAAGYWDGASCESCLDGYVGASCNQQCIFAEGAQCGGHGKCNSRVTCDCYDDATRGRWTGENCTTCKPGYYGAQCQSSCLGLGCGVCSGHGTCDDGRSGDGNCTCVLTEVEGYWGTDDCGDCAAGYYGPACGFRCPLNSSTCGGHGRCDGGIAGTGRCLCNEGWAVDSDGVCTLCASGYYGSRCAACGRHTAPPVDSATKALFNFSIPCSGRGQCRDGLSGSGTCSCDVGFSGTLCNVTCPVADGVTCGRAAVCTPNGCLCSGNYTLAADGSCHACKSGFYGSQCQYKCAACGNHGTCFDGIDGTGTCRCARGYAGTFCDQECPGGASNPCSGHGECLQSGVCDCHSPVNDHGDGYWAGTACSECNPDYLSEHCNVTCPRFNQQICNGRGTCYNGNCLGCAPLPTDSASIYCGEICHRSGIVCLTFETNCAPGFWGFGCVSLCPGADRITGDNSCTGHGTCSTDSGVCYCDTGYSGQDCSSVCPVVRIGNHDYVCNGRGACVNSTCKCNHGYYGPSCTSICRGGASNPCNGVGICDAVTGECTCAAGMAGPNCDIECAGGRKTPCNNHGQCRAADGTCSCDSNAGAGYFQGAACQRCTTTRGGGDCKSICVHGAGNVSGYNCVCDAGFAGVPCNITCPGYGTPDGLCAGHGTCFDGFTGDGTCTCVDGYFGAGCSQHCTPATCTSLYGMANPECNAANGTCECQDDTTGRWTGAECNECQAGHWGSSCNLVCPCNDHGACDQITGECFCFQDDSRGYWSGQECDACLSGYIGRDCRGKNIEFSTNDDHSASASVEAMDRSGAAAQVFVDELANVAYVGAGSPILVVNRNVIPNDVVASFRIEGDVLAYTYTTIDGTVITTNLNRSTHLRLLTRDAISGRTHAYLIPRGVSSVNASTGTIDIIAAPANATSGDVVQASHRHLLQASPSSLSSVSADFQTYHSSDAVFLLASVDGTVTLVFDDGEVIHNPGNLNATFDEIVSVQQMTTGFALAGSSDVTGIGATERWLVAVVSTAASSRGAVTLFSDATHRVSTCLAAATGPCSSAMRCVETRATSTSTSVHLVCLMLGRSGSVTAARFDTKASTSVQTAPATEIAYIAGATVNASAMAYDGEASLVIAALHSEVSASQLYKMRESDLTVTGYYAFQRVGLEYDRVHAITVLSDQREALVFLHRGLYSATLLSLNLFGVLKISPSVIDARGSTSVLVTGEGFSPFAAGSCVFGAKTVNATYLNETTMVCVAPESASTGGSCDALNFNVQFGTRQTSTTNAPFQRPSPAVLSGSYVDGYFAFANAGTVSTVIVRGVGFVSTPWGACRIREPSGTAAFLSFATFVNSTAMRCTVPSDFAPTRPPAFLEYSHDNQLYGAVSVPFAVVGTAAGISVRTPAPATTFRASVAARIPACVIHVVDSLDNSLYHLDDVTRSVTARLLRGEVERPFPWAAQAKTVASIENGVATMSELFVDRPTVGGLTVEFSVRVGGGLWTANAELAVVVGLPAQIKLESANATSTWYIGTVETSTLTPDPVVVVTDAAGNIATDAAELPAVIELRGITVDVDVVTGEPTSIDLVVQASVTGGVYAFRDVKMRGMYGEVYGLTFSAVGRSDVTQLILESIPLQQCVPGTEYGVLGSTSCLPCPTFGVCDGGVLVDVQDGFWRGGTDSTTFYECSPPYSANSCGEEGQCVTGYQGPRCSVCAAGYGKTGLSCTACLSPALSYFIIVLIVLVLLAGVFYLVHSSINAGRAAAEGKPADIVTVVVKMLLNHFQVCATVGLNNALMPDVLQDFFRGQQTASQVNPNLSFISCEVTPTYLGTFKLAAISPLLLAPIVALQIAFVVLKARQLQKAKDMLATSGQLAESAVERNKRSLMGVSTKYDAWASLMESAVFGGSAGVGGPEADEDGMHSPRSLPAPSTATRHSSGLGFGYIDGIARTETFVTNGTATTFDDINALPGESQMQEVGKRHSSIRKAALPKPPTALNILLQRCAVSLLVVLFFVYPTVLEVSGNMLRCEDIDYGFLRGIKSVLVADRSISCSTAEYESYRKAGLAQLVVYGLGLPLLAALLVTIVGRTLMKGDFRLARQLFYFMTGGYREGVWYWESVVLMRKAAVVLIAFAITDNQLKVYAGMWVMAAFFALNVVFKPFENVVLSRLETLSLITISISLNLSLLFQYFPKDTRPGEYYTVVTAIFLINCGVLLVFAVELLRAVRGKLKALLDADKHTWHMFTRFFEEPIVKVEAKTEALQIDLDRMKAAVKTVHPRLARVLALAEEAMRRFPEHVKIRQAFRALDEFTVTGAFRLQTFGSSEADVAELYRLEKLLATAWLSAERALRADAELLEIDLACDVLRAQSGFRLVTPKM